MANVQNVTYPDQAFAVPQPPMTKWTVSLPAHGFLDRVPYQFYSGAYYGRRCHNSNKGKHE